MAITRSQIARQLLNGGGASSNRGDRQGVGRGDKGGSDFGQFERRQRQNQTLQGAGFLGKDEGMNVGPQKNILQRGFETFKPLPLRLIDALGNIGSGTPVDTTMFNRGGDGQGVDPMLLYRRMMAQQARTTDNVPTEDEEEKKLEGLRLAFRAEGGRIGAQEGGIMPRLNQLGSGVSSAEQTLQDINQRLESAESSLGEGGGMQLPEIAADNLGTFPGNPNRQPMGQLFGSNKTPSLEELYPNAGQIQISNFRPMRGGAEMFEAAGIPAAGYADGGNVVGGEFDFESARQMYGLGKLVKKATRAVKKVAKSPIGKAALLYAGGAGLASLGAGQGLSMSMFGPKAFGSNLGASFLRLKASPLGEKIFGRALTDYGTREGGLLNFLKTPKGVTTAITAASLLPLLGLGTGDESEEEAQAIIDQSGLDIDAIRANPNEFLARRFKAEGGSMKEPVAKKTMPLLDMGGQEMDLRAEGGFVPIGRMEKADDVPARLSKNEFVFTADAVRNAGDGNVDKGAEVMYNMMKNLEAGGEVSEESQGLEGARRMFQTSQRLEEVL